MHTEQKVWSNWSLRQQNYLSYPTFTEYFMITWLLSVRVLVGARSAEHAEHA